MGVHNYCHIAIKWETEKVLDIMDVVGPILNRQYTLATYMDSYSMYRSNLKWVHLQDFKIIYFCLVCVCVKRGGGNVQVDERSMSMPCVK